MAKTVSVKLQVQDENLDEVRRKLEALGATVTKVGNERVDGLQKSLEAIQGRLDPAARAAQRLSKDTDTLNKALAAGKVTGDQHARMLADLQRAAAAAARATAAANDNLARSTGTTARQMQVLNAAALNSFQSLASGAPVMQTLVTQGAQLVGAFGSISAAALVVGGGVAVAAGGLAALARSAIEAGDAMTQAEGRLRAATGSTAAARDVYEDLYQLSLRTGTAVAESAGQFVRFRIAGNAVGATNAEVVRLVETVQKFGIVSGASTSEAQAGALQLAQALASGKLQGDELRSILENMPLLAQEIASQLGVPIGKLREMGEAGELTAERIFKAILDAKEKADEQFAQMPLTVERASNIMGASWERFTAEIDRSLGLSQKLAGVLQGTASLINQLTGAIQVTALERYSDVQKQLAELQRQINAGNTGVLGEANSIRDLGGDDQAGRAYAEQRLAQLRAQAKALHDTALAELRLRERREEQEQVTKAAAKAEAARTAAVEAYKGAVKGLHPEEEARAKRDEKRAAIMAALDEGLIRNEDGTIDLARAQRDLAAVEQEYQDALKKGEPTKARASARTAEETDKVEAYIASLRRATDRIGEDSRTRTINEAVAKGQALAIEKGTLLTDEQSATIRRLSAARYDDEAATKAQAAAQRDAVQAVERFNSDVKRVAEDIGKDISSALWDQITGEAKGADALEWFKRWLKRLAVEALNQNIVLPITTKIVGSMPGLFGIEQAASAAAGQTVTIGGQTYVPAGGGTGSTSLFGGGNGLAGIDQMAARWLPGTFAMPYDALPKNLVSGIDDVGQLGYTTTANSTLPFSAGEFMTGVGSIVSAVNAFQAFSAGKIGSGIGSTISAGLGIASLAGVALGPLGPIAMIAAPIIGGLLDGLFAKKPSTKEGGSTINLGTGAETIGGQTGKKFSQENRDAASAMSNAVYDMYKGLSDLAGGMTLTKDFFVGVGDRDGIRAQFNGPSNEKFFTRDDQGVKDMTAWFAGVFTRELKSGFEEPVQRAIDNIQWDSLEEGLKQLQFALEFDTTMDNLAGNFSLEDTARKQAKDSVKQTTKAFEELLDTTEQLWPSVMQGGQTVTTTTRELASMPAADAIAKGLIREVDSYIGEGMNERVWQDLEGRIVQVANDLSGTVSIWQEAAKTVTEGGTAVASAELARANAAIRSRVALMIAGTPEQSYTGGEASVAAAQARWDLPTIKPLLEMAGYAGDELARKAAEGLRNELAGLREANDQGQISRRLGLGGVDLSTGATAAAQYATAIRDVTALHEAGATRTAELAEEQGLLNDTLLAAVGLGRPVSALSVSVADFTAALGLSSAAVTPMTAALDAMQTAASDGTATQQTLTDTITFLSDHLRAGTFDADQYAAAVGRVTSQMREAVAMEDARRAGTFAIEQAIDQGWRPSADALLASLHVTPTAIDALRDTLDGLTTEAAAGTVSAQDLRDAEAVVRAQLDAHAITTAQYTSIVGALTSAYQDSQTAAAAATQATQDAAAAATQAAQDAAAAVAASEQAISRIRAENAQAAIQSLQEQITAQEQASSRWTAIAASLKNARDGLLSGDLSPLNPAARRDEARRQAEEAVKAARAGDADAAERVPELVRGFLEASRALNATGTAYAADFAWGRDALAGLETEAQRQARTADAQLGVLRASLATEQAMLQALQRPSQTDLAPVLAGLTTGNLGSVVEWARRQGPDTLQSVLSAADRQLGWQNNPYRYSSGEDIAYLTRNFGTNDWLAVGRQIGFTGGLADLNPWLVARGKQAEFEAAVRGYMAPQYATGTPSAVPGWAWVGDGGGPELMRMRGGEQIIPHPQAVSMARAWEEAARRPPPANDRWRPALTGDGRGDGALQAELRTANRRIAELTRTVDRMARMLGDQGADQLALQRDIADSGRAAAAGARRKVV